MNSPDRALPRLWSPNANTDVDDINNISNNKKLTKNTNSKPNKCSVESSVNNNHIKNDVKPENNITTQINTRYSPTIKEIPLEDRPRERLITIGAQALTTAELIAILIHIGNSERSAVSLGECILAHFGNISGVASATVEELSIIKGIGNAKAAQILASIEFGKRVTLFSSESKPQINNPRDVANIFSTVQNMIIDNR